MSSKTIGFGVARLFVVLIVLAACRPAVDDPRSAAVAMPDEFSRDAALSVLESGGNAVDAAVAAAFVLAVTYPEAGNLGGGGFMLAYVDGEAAFLDYREVAPAAATVDMFLDEAGNVVDDLSLVGPLAAGVPGTVAGLSEAHRRYGTLPWPALLEHAIHLADSGFVVPPLLAQRVAEEAAQFAGRTNFHEFFGEVRAGARFRQPALAATLRRIAAAGAAGFYTGETAVHVQATMAASGGLIAANDLAQYRAVWREPLAASWRQYTVITAPPPSSGGFAVLQLLGMKDALDSKFRGQSHNSARYVHLIAEMSKRVFADRAEYFGDPDFVAVPIAGLIDPGYIERRAGEVDPAAISAVGAVEPGLEAPQTTHFSIVDFDGNAVANTYTLNTSFGSGVVVAGAGFLLNNQMDDFSAKPDVPNFYGVVGGSANAIAPRKRMLSSMSPTIVLDGNRVDAVLGTPGGSTIFTSVFQALVNMYDFGMSAGEAAAATRFHHQLLPRDLITISPGRTLPAGAGAELAAMGYRLAPHGWDFGDLQIVRWRDGGYVAGVDPRGRGAGASPRR